VHCHEADRRNGSRDEAIDTGGPIMVPVDARRSAASERARQPVDKQRSGDAESTLSIHRQPPRFDEQSTNIEMFETASRSSIFS